MKEQLFTLYMLRETKKKEKKAQVTDERGYESYLTLSPLHFSK